jgi:hypothetical protein
MVASAADLSNASSGTPVAVGEALRTGALRAECTVAPMVDTGGNPMDRFFAPST